MALEWETDFLDWTTPPPIPPPPPVPPFLKSELCLQQDSTVTVPTKMDLLLQLSIFLMLGSLGLLVTFTFFLCVFRLCFCGNQTRFTPRQQRRGSGDMLDQLLDEENGQVDESEINLTDPSSSSWSSSSSKSKWSWTGWLRQSKVSCSSAQEVFLKSKDKCDSLQHELKCTKVADETIRHM
ncbi:hypothetical protein TCAL_09440 [Tigriopus californicus]|uniref:Uncharacterized protein n=1 Tax=Tigriopus californicus TaxID=6832 RepID=A0A553P1K7_TIGCA|nr:uncharacterized protein LOC131884039 [Tigriopus californicus]XP_059087655.1 uncharacterized protein LOC131884039 [Tigriopus californicus]XP_059087656.1 uncharacterized protein LOC131884039 [Tigriopus californicus]TRY71502.1 hypothetical protein TCAL_09440 [Tigriopus californicus]|eukprot:TCALIF_09440-PA protein Name:"Protein of unknown function" AED:0.15 eAED:0.15 QI:193/1/0.75/1/0.33/0.5/4/0/180